ncbi:hypothetical protein BGZ70_007764 [Mortierella alpina]|uniref:MARVEL domain-containing protein n=1 Tax=Mortierella alpina TaxID=64518 RepID=A0A9P6M6P2_MORAP|nr:hypothetical protein BGZ70_007764 [Mortierella alpina]
MAPQPHLPSSVYSPNPFPLDPTRPDGISRNNIFVHQERETEAVAIEVEETRGFVSGKSRQSLDRQVDHYEEREDYRRTNNTTIQRLGAGFKGALAKSGLNMSRDKNTEQSKEPKQVDAVLLHHQRQQQRQRQKRQEEMMHAEESEELMRPIRGRERQRAQSSGPFYANDAAPDRDHHRAPRDDRHPMHSSSADRRPRLHSLSPPPASEDHHRSQRDTLGYWPDGYRGLHSELDEQMSPFLGYQPPPHASSSRPRPHQQYRPRPMSLVSDADYHKYSRQSHERRMHSQERYDSDRTRREAFGLETTPRKQSGLNRVMNVAPSTATGSVSEFADDETTSSLNEKQQQQREAVPDRLSRAKEWVASHSRNTSIAIPPPVADREAPMSSLPGSFPSRPRHRLSMDSDVYGRMSPTQPGYYHSPGAADYASHERMAMISQMQMHGLSRNHRNSLGQDGRYWEHHLEGYERERYQQTRQQYEYDGRGAGFYGYAAGGPDDAVEGDGAESTLAPASLAGGITKPKKALDLGAGVKQEGADSKATLAAAPSDTDEEELHELTLPKLPNRKRLILRLISLVSSLLVLIFLIAASPVSRSSAPFSSKAGLAFHYIVGIVSILISCAFVFNYFSRRLRRKPKMKRYVLLGLDIFMTLMWLIDIFVCISKFPCAVGGQDGWCDMYNTSIFLSMIAFASFLAAFIWDIWGSFNHSKPGGGRPWIRPPPPGFDNKVLSRPGVGGGVGAQGGGGGGVGAWPGQMPGQGVGGGPMKPKNSKALW